MSPIGTGWKVILLATVLLSLRGWASPVDSGCAELYDPREAGLPTPPAGVAQVTCASFFPYAVVLDGSETTRVEVRILGPGITAVDLAAAGSVVGVHVDGVPFPQTGGFMALFDDGTHGDRVAGDDIWSRGGISLDAVPVPPIREVTFDRVRYTDAGGTQTINIRNSNGGQFGPARLGGLSAAVAAAADTTLVAHGTSIHISANVAFMVDTEAFAELRWLLRARPPTADIYLVGQRFYAQMPDAFDKLMLMPGAAVPGAPRGLHLGGANQVQGIGKAIFDQSALWGSDGRLDSVFTLNWSEGGPVLHELTHNWGVQISDTLGFQQCAPAHWGLVGSGNGTLGGFNPDVLVDNGDGTWSFPNGQGSGGGPGADTTAMSPMELYVAGFIPPEEVPPILMPVNLDCTSITQNATSVTFAADAVVTVTIADIVAVHGPRLPAASESQRNFTMAWLVPINRVPTMTEVAFMQYRSEYVARQAPGDQALRLTFWEAVGGRATLDTRLPVFSDSIFTDRFQPP